jgi:hypothetical protein
MASTYEKIATTTLGSGQTSVTFSSIPSTYTDLVLVSGSLVAAAANNFMCEMNGDTGTTYSTTYMYGNGSSALSGRQSTQYGIILGGIAGGVSSSEPSTVISQFQNYANTTTNKTVLSRGNLASASTDATIGLWRSTAAINSIKVYVGFGNSATPGGNLNTGSVFTLYGIKAA